MGCTAGVRFHRVAASEPGGHERLSVGLTHDFPGGHFELCGHRDFVCARHARSAPSSELPGTETREDRELERGEVSWTMYHRTILPADATRQEHATNEVAYVEYAQRNVPLTCNPHTRL